MTETKKIPNYYLLKWVILGEGLCVNLRKTSASSWRVQSWITRVSAFSVAFIGYIDRIMVILAGTTWQISKRVSTGVGGLVQDKF